MSPISIAAPSSATPGFDPVSRFPPGFLEGFGVRDLPGGYLLATPGQPLDQVFIVRSGRVRVYLASEARELSLAILEPGDVFVTHTPTFVQTLEPVTLWVLGTREFAARLAREPSITPAIMRVLGRILSNAVALVEDLAFRDVPARLARFLVRQAEQRGVMEADGCLLPLRLGTEDIACLLGTTRQSVSSQMNQWQREGLLTRRSRHALLIHDLPALALRSLASSG